MAEHNAAPTSLHELVESRAEEPADCSLVSRVAGRSKCSQAGLGASRDPTLGAAVQRGSPRPFAGYSNSDFAYIGFAPRRHPLPRQTAVARPGR